MQKKFEEIPIGKIRIIELEIETDLLCASFSFLCITNSIICVAQSVKVLFKEINYNSITERFTYLRNSGDILPLN